MRSDVSILNLCGVRAWSAEVSLNQRKLKLESTGKIKF